ncbi:putative esterase of the alpha-beta hydrolase superfamily protein [Natrinema versiforme JCM 10478]|uniref:Putative esterase of the alpha-beta hydrolase superfamily protein n=2 Tax=Natrinema versiforme TaxID=88724 RepID=L9Y5J8_9EURY|nr:putative esterase of the alpha-beta hydrolase superfamily protein [Natrinema versiforme JCM 10478]
MTELRTMGVGLPQYSPTQTPAGMMAQRELRSLLEQHVDFERVRSLSDTIRERRRTENAVLPALLVSAIDVLTGEFRVFRGHEMSADAVLASAAEPGIFDAIDVDDGYYWDGLFSKNPPVRDFSTAADIPDPDEVWLVQINPSTRSKVPRSQAEIADRRNELSGNTALEQEVAFIEQVNEWVDAGYLPDRYTHTDPAGQVRRGTPVVDETRPVAGTHRRAVPDRPRASGVFPRRPGRRRTADELHRGSVISGLSK